MSVYGMGSLFCGTEEQLDNFVNEGFVCIGWKKEDKPELYAILNNIKIGDIIYIKALPLSSKTMIKTENTHHGYEECGNEIGIKWLKSNINKSINIDDSNINKRKGSLFIETNTDYIDKIISFI